MRAILLLVMAALPAAAITYFKSDSFGSTGGSWTGAGWVQNGTLSAGSPNGLYSSATGGGSVILDSTVTNPTTSQNDIVYELKATFRIQASGGTFVLYSHATTNALVVNGNTGTFYAAAFTPTLTSGGCTMNSVFSKSISGSVTTLYTRTMACKDGMTVRWTQRNGYFSIYTSLDEFLVNGDGTITSGRPGFGVIGLPAANGITLGEVAHLEFVAPDTIVPSSFRTAAFDNRIDLAWTGVVDNAGGSGLVLYQVHRSPGPPSGGSFMGNARGAFFSDSTVSPGVNYTYTIYPHDVHLNLSSTSVDVKTPATGVKDPRKLGVRPLGTYWGASPENIDLQSGNLSFSLPTVTAQGRGGTAVPFRLSYNSQNWRKDPAKAWLLGTDVGYGFGWKLLAGSLTPIYNDWFSINHYVYTDSSGAEYDLDVNDAGIWRSKTGIFIEYDATARRLYFPGGTYWEFDCTANGTEADAGTLYPTRLVDTNGNEIKVRYQGGLHYGGLNGSARVAEVEDVRSVFVSPVYKSYTFNYNSDAIPHLINIATHVPGDSSNIQFTYSTASALVEPFANSSPNFGTAVDLMSMTVPGNTGLQFSMTYYSGSHEFRKVTMPYGGTIEWAYDSKTIGNDRTIREVTSRTLNAADGQGDKLYTISHNDAADLTALAHLYTTVKDASNAADKKYNFSVASDWTLGLITSLEERKIAGSVKLRESAMTWVRTTNLNPYISATVETMDPGQTYAISSKVEQTIDDYGNLKERKQYSHYGTGGTPALARTFTYTYLDSPNYRSRHIWNRPVSVTVQKPGGTVITLSTNTYDVYPYGAVDPVAIPANLRQHDTANYGTAFVYRGNVTRSVSPGKAANLYYDYTGTAWKSYDDYGHQATQTSDSSKNYAVPSAITAGSLSTSFTWNGANEMMSSTGPNGATASFSYDIYLRPYSRTAPNGSVTTFTYSSSVPYWTIATTGTRWTKTTVDGFGRTLTTETGYNSTSGATSVSLVDTKYAPCACTPVGKLWKSSLPYAPGTLEANKLWVEHYYDALGRTVEVKQPSAAGSTTYEYTGAAVKVIDPKGKWKKFTNNAFGNLINVQEPRPGGGTPYETDYTYSELGQLLTVTMTRPGKGVGAPATVTQVRTWVYDSNQRLYSVVHPESGTTLKPSVRYNYNPDGSVQWKMDAKDQKTVYTYDTDGRVSVVQRYLTGGTEDTCAKVEFFYNSQTFDATFSQNATGRLAATATGCTPSGAGKLIEMYSYNVAGAVVTKRLRIVRGSGTVDKDVAYTYGTDGKLATVLYPGTTVPYTYSYDLMDRPNKMTGPAFLLGNTTVDLVKDVNFGVAGQLTSMKYMQWQDNGAVNFFTENRTYNSLFQLTRQETAGAAAAADIEYSYTSSGSTLNDGRIVSRKNNMRNGASGETVTYNYDELNRVTQASSSVGWAQSFDYDGFGNMWTANMAGGTATPFNATYSQTTSTNRIATAGWGYDDNGNTTAMPVTGGYASLAYDVDNRLKTWTGPAGTEEYGYLADNKRVWKKSPAGVETVYFYGVGGQKLLTYTLQTSPLVLVAPSENVYFGGKLIRADGQSVVHDRLGSVVARGDSSSSFVTKHDYLPYGEEMGTPTSGNVSKFGTYLRDQTTGLDSADQRFYGSTGGRFLTADPYEASGGASEPGSWGRYAYVGGDPVNGTDPSGLFAEEPDIGFFGYGFGDPFEGLGLRSGANGPDRPRTLACLSGLCIRTDNSCEVTGQQFAPGSATCVAMAMAFAGAQSSANSRPSSRRIVSALRLLDMCWKPGDGPLIGRIVLNVQYQVLDQMLQPIYGVAPLIAAGATVSENLVNASGDPIKGGGVWCPNGGNCPPYRQVLSPSGTFWDTIAGPLGGAESSMTQTFSANGNILPILGFPPLVFNGSQIVGVNNGFVNYLTTSIAGGTVNGLTALRRCGAMGDP